MTLLRGKFLKNPVLEPSHREQEVADAFGLVQGTDRDTG